MLGLYVNVQPPGNVGIVISLSVLQGYRKQVLHIIIGTSYCFSGVNYFPAAAGGLIDSP